MERGKGEEEENRRESTILPKFYCEKEISFSYKTMARKNESKAKQTASRSLPLNYCHL